MVQIFMKRTDTRPYAVRKMFRHPLYPFMISDFDFFVKLDEKIYLLECKTSFSYHHMNGWEGGKYSAALCSPGDSLYECG